VGIVVVLLSRAKRLLPAPVLFLRLRINTTCGELEWTARDGFPENLRCRGRRCL